MIGFEVHYHTILIVGNPKNDIGTKHCRVFLLYNLTTWVLGHLGLGRNTKP